MIWREWLDKDIRCIPIDYIPASAINGRIIEGPIIKRSTPDGNSGCHVIVPQQWSGCVIKCIPVDQEGFK
jgi:hypothetical protein